TNATTTDDPSGDHGSVAFGRRTGKDPPSQRTAPRRRSRVSGVRSFGSAGARLEHLRQVGHEISLLSGAEISRVKMLDPAIPCLFVDVLLNHANRFLDRCLSKARLGRCL